MKMMESKLTDKTATHKLLVTLHNVLLVKYCVTYYVTRLDGHYALVW